MMTHVVLSYMHAYTGMYKQYKTCSQTHSYLILFSLKHSMVYYLKQLLYQD